MLKMSTYAKLYHIAATGFCIYTLYNIHDSLNYPGPGDNKILQDVKRFSALYLTNWTFMCQTLYFGTCMMSYFLGLFTSTRSLKQKIDVFSDDIVTTITTPMAFMVSLVFWSIYLIDRELIYPKVIDSMLSTWINHSIHTINSIIALGDLVLVNHKYPPWKTIMTIMLLYLLAYGFCILGTYIETGLWLYPFLGTLSWTTRIMFVICTYVGALAMVGVAKFISYVIWGVSVAVKAKKGNKPKHKKK